jgi:hypothetical protein
MDLDLPPTRLEQIHYGADLFDHGAWWESHVAWEAAWLTFPRRSPEGLALKGLIQAAAMQLKTTPAFERARRRLKDRSTYHLDLAVRAGLPVLERLPLEPLIDAIRDHHPSDGPLQLGFTPADRKEPIP